MQQMENRRTGDEGDQHRAATAMSWRRHPLLMLRQPLRRSAPPRPAQEVTASRSEVLRRLRELPTSLWSYGWESNRVRHLGPMAQDFWDTFGLEAHLAAAQDHGPAGQGTTR